ncbi:hypothetical protein Cantr_01384 [Candida viswanathii]|uniref:Uncharacterized protein n=1 Tax=Candida viswanathii TaxID=5486 RepID=A0A367YHL9_9ASCO|nr:hypothetical protein Cantr_01384 [Candida viswanathii]
MSKASIAIIGLNGFLGAPVVAAINSGLFDDKIAYPIKAITRKEPAEKSDKIEYIVVDVSTESVESIVAKLGHVDTFVELISPNPDVFAKIEDLVGALKPKLFIPSQFGTDIPAVDTYAPGFLGIKTKHADAVRKLGIKVVDVVTSLFAAPGAFLYEWVAALGANVEDKTVTVVGDINQKFHISKLEDIANTVLALATNPDPQSLPDVVRVASDVVTPKIVIDTYSKNHGGVEFKTVSEKTAEEGKQEFAEALGRGFEKEKFFWYLQVIVAQGLDKGLYFSKLDNELVNPGESVWKWGKW